MGNQPSDMLTDEQSRAREIQRLDSEVSQKFHKSTNWNMKVVIRGDRSTGKTSLFNRLQGKPFPAEYVPSDTLSSANISWNYRTSHDVVKVEVWDVVDALRAKKTTDGGLKLTNKSTSSHAAQDNEDTGEYDEVDLDTVPVPGKVMSPTGKSALNLDTSKVDVLRGTNAVVLLYNPRKKWTWEYVQREVKKIPERIHVLIMANFKDLAAETIQVTNNDVRHYIDLLDRPAYFLEGSMLNCYGLKGLKTFLNVPFLYMKREMLETQLKLNLEELQVAQDEYQLTTENDSYDTYLQMLTHRNPNMKNSSNGITNLSSNTNPSSTTKPTVPAATPNRGASAPVTPNKEPGTPSSFTPTIQKASANQKSTPVIQSPITTPESTGSFFSKLFSKKDDPQAKATQADKQAVEELKKLKEMGIPASSGLESVDDFVPEENDSWLDDEPVSGPKIAALVAKTSAAATAAPKQAPSKFIITKKPDSDDDDDDAPNSMIANYADELEDSDQLIQEALAKARAEKAEKEKKAKQAQLEAEALKKKLQSTDSDDEDDGNPALAQYEDDLDFEDQQIKGNPAPPAPKPTIVVAPEQLISQTVNPARMGRDSDDDDEPNPALAGYEEDLDFADLSPTSSLSPAMRASVTSSPVPTSIPQVPKVSPVKQAASVSPVVTPLAAPVSSPSTNANASNIIRSSPSHVVKQTYLDSDDSSDDGGLVAKDDEGDSDEDYAGFVPKKSASAFPVEDTSFIPDFNPMDADSEADADAFWASTRQPTRKSAVSVQPQQSIAPVDPFSFNASGTPESREEQRKDKKDKRDKKEKRHKDKGHRHHSSSSTGMQQQHQQQAPPPQTATPPPAAAKKSVFYL